MSAPFSFASEAIDLPKGAIARTHRWMLRWRGRPLLSLSQGPFRPYLYPLYSPAGHPVLEESPADHPHHNGVWVAADHLHCLFPLGDDRYEQGTYGFFVNDTFQGRAPGRIETVEVAGAAVDEARFNIAMRAEWRGAREWGAPEGRVIAREARDFAIAPGEGAHVIDVHSALSATEWDLVIGPTRHAYFGVRIADGLRVTQGGRLSDAKGRDGGPANSDHAAAWLDYSGPAAGGETAGIAILAGAMPPHRWFATDWGVIHLNPFADAAATVHRGDTMRLAMRLVVHDGAADAGALDALAKAFRAADREGESE